MTPTPQTIIYFSLYKIYNEREAHNNMIATKSMKPIGVGELETVGFAKKGGSE